MSEHSAHDSFREQFPKNLCANLANFLLNIIIGILLVPYFISTLGIAAYGLIPLATSLTSFVTILTDSLNAAISRFITVDLQRHDFEKANKTFNTALFGISGIIILLIPVLVILSYYAPIFFNIPLGQESEVIFLFFGVFAAFLIRSWSSTFTVSLFAYNRLDLLNLLNIISVIFQVSLILLLFTIFSPQLSYIGFAYLVSNILFLFGAIVLSNRINPHFRIDVQEFDRSKIKELTSMGWWVIVDQIGSLLFLQIDLMVVNLLFGATVAGEYSIAFLWVILLRGLASTLSGVLSPMILTYYAQEKHKQLIYLSKSGIKGLGLLMALPIGLICGFAPNILTLWVGPQFSHLAPLILVLTLPLSISLCIAPLFSINVAFNKVRIPAIITLFMGIGDLILAFSLPLVFGWGYYGVAIAGGIVLTLRSALFVPWYAAKVMGISSKTFIKPMILGVFAMLTITGLTTVLGKFFTLSTLINLTIFCGIISIVYLIVIWFIGFNKFEREIFTSYIPKKMRITE